MGAKNQQHCSDPAEANAAEVKLLESALTLFSDKGYEGTSIREITERAGVRHPVLYYCFESQGSPVLPACRDQILGVLSAHGRYCVEAFSVPRPAHGTHHDHF
jgi:hypothetical protein